MFVIGGILFNFLETTCCSTDKCNGPNLEEAKNSDEKSESKSGSKGVKGGSGNSGNHGDSVKASLIGAFTTILVAMAFIK